MAMAMVLQLTFSLTVAEANLPLAEIVSGLLSNLNGPATPTVAVNGPATLFGSRHESEQVSPHPYEKL